jgi:hypothetical protein
MMAGYGLYAQAGSPSTYSTSPAEDSIFMYFQRFQGLNDTESRQKLNDTILDYFSRVLTVPESLDYRFDSLRKNAGILDSPDGRFRIFTWNVPMSYYEHQLHGLIQVNNGDSEPCSIHILEDQLGEIPDPLHAETGPRKWPGALYYDIQRNKHGKTVFYTVIGYNFHDRWSDKKIIDIIHFNGDRIPRFGKPVFNSPEGIQHRVIFEYSGDVAMNLRYNPDLKMIVYDHLAPIEPELKNHPRFYAPDFSYDGYKFRKGIWEHRSEVDVRNR